MTDQMVKQLIEKALEARKYAYTPYSHFRVGAALLSQDGQIFTGCNIESASFSPTNCAERTALFKAVSEGVRTFEAIAVVGAPEDEVAPFEQFAAPCGVCRQMLYEFSPKGDLQVILAKSPENFCIYSLSELLPLAFVGDSLKTY